MADLTTIGKKEAIDTYEGNVMLDVLIFEQEQDLRASCLLAMKKVIVAPKDISPR